MKADPRLGGTPIVLVTSLDAAEDRAAGLDAGADALPREARGRARQAPRGRPPAPPPRMIRCLLVDDSRAFRAILRVLLERAGVEVVGEAADGDAAVAQVLALRPDVVTMDVRMPGKDGLAAIEEIMRVAPTPIVVVSAEAGPERQEISFRALELGAVEVLAKPRATDAVRFEREVEAIRAAIRAVAGLKLVTRHRRRTLRPSAARAAPVPPWPRSVPSIRAPRVLGIAASTGGPAALARILRALPREFPAAILVVQHIAPGFEAGLVHWLGTETRLAVKLAEQGEPLRPGTVYVGARTGTTSPPAAIACGSWTLRRSAGSAPPARSCSSRSRASTRARRRASSCPGWETTAPTASARYASAAAGRLRRGPRPPWCSACRPPRSSGAPRRRRHRARRDRPGVGGCGGEMVGGGPPPRVARPRPTRGSSRGLAPARDGGRAARGGGRCPDALPARARALRARGLEPRVLRGDGRARPVRRHGRPATAAAVRAGWEEIAAAASRLRGRRRARRHAAVAASTAAIAATARGGRSPIWSPLDPPEVGIPAARRSAGRRARGCASSA